MYKTSLFLPPPVGRRKAIGLSPSSSRHLPIFCPSLLSLFPYRPLPKAVLSPYKARWDAFGRVAIVIQVSNVVCLRLSGLRENSVICPSGGPWRSTWAMGEEEEEAWPERSEGLVRPVLCVCVSYMLQREAGFVSFHTLSVRGPFTCWEPHPSFASKVSPAFSHFSLLGFGIPKIFGKRDQEEWYIWFLNVRIRWWRWFFFFFLVKS